jgi:hypothetical protein
MKQLFVFMTIWFLLVACVPTLIPAANTSPEATPTATQPACQPSKTQISKNEFPEIQGTMKSDGELWALLFFDSATANQDLKFVWRITTTGTGQGFHIEAKNENGKTILPIWGPEFHGGSNWNRPGEEWGTGFNFPEAGCWTITVTSGATIGEIYIDVLAH